MKQPHHTNKSFSLILNHFFYFVLKSFFALFLFFRNVSMAEPPVGYPDCLALADFKFTHQGSKPTEKKVCLAPPIVKVPFWEQILQLDIDFATDIIITSYVKINLGPTRKKLSQLLVELDLREKELNYIYGKADKNAKEAHNFLNYFSNDSEDNNDDKTEITQDDNTDPISTNQTEDDIIEECTSLALSEQISKDKLQTAQEFPDQDPIIDLGQVEFHVHIQSNKIVKKSEPAGYTTISYQNGDTYVILRNTPHSIQEKKYKIYTYSNEYTINLFQSFMDRIIKTKNICLDKNHSKIKKIRRLFQLDNSARR